MANMYSAQGSITIKRLRTGENLFLSLNASHPLYQSVDDKTGAVAPDWTVDANRPVITPSVSSSRGGVVHMNHHKWSYNGVELVFSGAKSGVYTLDITGRFGMNVDTGVLKIFKNLASVTNVANDTLTYEGQASISGIEQNITKTIDIVIQPMGGTSYYGSIIATTAQIGDDVPTSTLSTKLYLSGNAVLDYYIKWKKDTQDWTAKNGQKSITVTRDDVAGTQLILADFYSSNTSTIPVFTSAIRIQDISDEYTVVCSITSANKMVDNNATVTVEGAIVNVKTNSIVNPAGAVWETHIMDRNTWKPIRSTNTKSIVVSISDMDKAGTDADVDVVSEVTWEQ